LPNRKLKQIRERYNLYLKPGINKTEFTEEENQKLLHYVNLIGHQFSILSKQIFLNRNPKQLQNQYHKLVARKSMKANEFLLSSHSSCLKNEKENPSDCCLCPRNDLLPSNIAQLLSNKQEISLNSQETRNDQTHLTETRTKRTPLIRIYTSN
jgi:hypothetical protein